jgi:hypothetical protein
MTDLKDPRVDRSLNALRSGLEECRIMSIPSQRRPMVLATAQVVPVPQKGSRTTSPMNV